MNDKKKITLLKAIIIFLILIFLLFAYQFNQTEPISHIHGTYQNTDLSELYTFTFNSHKGTYLISYGSVAFAEGTFEKYENNSNLYICNDKSGKTSLLTLLHDGFFYYDSENDKVVKMIKKSDVPITIIPQ